MKKVSTFSLPELELKIIEHIKRLNANMQLTNNARCKKNLSTGTMEYEKKNIIMFFSFK